MIKLLLAMVLLYGGVLFSGLVGHSFWMVPVFSVIFLISLAWSRPSMVRSAGGLLGVWIVQLILAAFIFSLARAIGLLWGAPPIISPAIPIILSASSVIVSIILKAPRGDDLNTINAAIDDIVETLDDLDNKPSNRE